MSISKLNAEGYLDLTAFKALSAVVKAENAVVKRKLIVYIASPYRGDVEGNVERTKDYCRFAVGKGTIPLAPHLLYPQFIDDTDKEQRKLGLSFAITLLGKCDELWVMGENITDGMFGEMEAAQKRGMPIRYFNSKYEEVRK